MGAREHRISHMFGKRGALKQTRIWPRRRLLDAVTWLMSPFLAWNGWNAAKGCPIWVGSDGTISHNGDSAIAQP